MTTATSREPARTPHAQSAGSRTTLTVITTSAAAGAIAGATAYYLVDRIAFLWGATVKQTRRAGWNARRRAA